MDTLGPRGHSGSSWTLWVVMDTLGLPVPGLSDTCRLPVTLHQVGYSNTRTTEGFMRVFIRVFPNTWRGCTMFCLCECGNFG